MAVLKPIDNKFFSLFRKINLNTSLKVKEPFFQYGNLLELRGKKIKSFTDQSSYLTDGTPGFYFTTDTLIVFVWSSLYIESWTSPVPVNDLKKAVIGKKAIFVPPGTSVGVVHNMISGFYIPQFMYVLTVEIPPVSSILVNPREAQKREYLYNSKKSSMKAVSVLSKVLSHVHNFEKNPFKMESYVRTLI